MIREKEFFPIKRGETKDDGDPASDRTGNRAQDQKKGESADMKSPTGDT